MLEHLTNPTFLLKDHRAWGYMPWDKASTLIVGERTPLAHALEIVRCWALCQDSPGTVYVHCHGKVRSHTTVTENACGVEKYGGHGLQLCKEGLTIKNVSVMAKLRGLVSRIVIGACSPADTDPFDFLHNGKFLLSEMARYSGATVYASDATQHGFTYTTELSRLVPQHLPFSSGILEGNVWRFSPTGAYYVVDRNPLQDDHNVHGLFAQFDDPYGAALP